MASVVRVLPHPGGTDDEEQDQEEHMREEEEHEQDSDFPAATPSPSS